MGPGVAAGAAADRPAAAPGSEAKHSPLEQWSAPQDSRCRELDCIRHLLPAGVLEAAQERARKTGTGADRVLIAAGLIDEETYLLALAGSLGIRFEPLDGVARERCPVADDRLIAAAATGLLPLSSDDGLVVVVAPRGASARRIVQLIDDDRATAARFRLTSSERFNRFVLRYAGKALTARASEALKQQWPMLSAASQTRLGSIAAMAAITIGSLAAYAFAPTVTVGALEVLLATMFLAWLGLRLTGALIRQPPPDRSANPADATLPVYTIISALYREAASVEGLLRAIERLDYPGIR
ncbi:MAG TPA: hypothetical protein VFC54_08080 [Pseudolabrys sp.]|nr:hypothetical protein [Pseudolabrys sp.]